VKKITHTSELCEENVKNRGVNKKKPPQ